jgi:FkbM family methyltransferase
MRKRLGRNHIFYELPGGVKLRCHPDNTVASQLWYFGPFTEYDELKFLTRYLRAGDGVVDAGANIGLYSFLAAPIIGLTGRVDAFEPGTIASERFQETLELNALPQVHLHRAAVSDREGTVLLTTDWDVSNRVLIKSSSEVGTEMVNAVTLDSALPDRPYAYAKLDVEGAEYLALRGAERRLAAHDPPVWQLEIFGDRLQLMSSSKGQVTELVRDHGYCLVSYEARPNRLRRATTLDGSHKNLLAVAESRWVEVLSRLGSPHAL